MIITIVHYVLAVSKSLKQSLNQSNDSLSLWPISSPADVSILIIPAVVVLFSFFATGVDSFAIDESLLSSPVYGEISVTS